MSLGAENKIVLFKNKSDCCACGACVNACPKSAITMEEDECGFLYPQIDSDLCVGCGACRKVCSFQNREETNSPQKVYAAVSKDSSQMKNSASGGIFAALATYVIQNGDVVFGAAFDNDFGVNQVMVDKLSELYKLQGSKYVHSSTGDSYKQVKELLAENRFVVYSGLPCQVAGLYGFLGQDYPNLLTVDIVCHGTPSGRMFKDFIGDLEKKYDGKITYFTFRDKSLGWGINGKAVINNEKEIKLWQSSNPYFHYFSKGTIYRENCYSCKYACEHRPGDITLGDFWGIEKQHPDFLGKGGWDESEGISLVLANTPKAVGIVDLLKSFIDIRESDFEKASAGNGQLKQPCQSGNRDELMECYRSRGWDGLVELFNKNIGIKRYSSQLKSLIPQSIKRKIKG